MRNIWHRGVEVHYCQSSICHFSLVHIHIEVNKLMHNYCDRSHHYHSVKSYIWPNLGLLTLTSLH